MTEIKKELYKVKPQAYISSVRQAGILYTTLLNDDFTVNFLVPLHELGETVWSNKMDAKLLIRYILE